MARPRSEDKKQALLAAAITLFAEEGLSASTSRIAKAAGVAEGTLFTYFASKDELINALYLSLKEELHAALKGPAPDTLKERLRHAWEVYVSWGLAHPTERQVLARLGLSDRITDETRRQVADTFCEVARQLDEARKIGELGKHPASLIETIFGAMAEATLEHVRANPQRRKAVVESSFAVFWKGIS